MKLYYRGILDKDHSWGVVATELTLALEKLGFTIGLADPIHKATFDPNRIDPRLENKLTEDLSNDLILSYCVPPNLRALPSGPIAHIYNYEFSEIPKGWAQLINKSSNLFLPSSKFAKDIFIKNGVRSEITEVLPHGIDLNKYNPQITPYNFNSNNFVFLCVSSPHYRKGLDILLQAFGEEFATIEEVELIIKTQIPKKKTTYEVDIRKLLDDARKYVALPKVRVITDYYPSLAPLYRAAHAYVSCNHSECFGLTELEAVCCGLPVIATDYGGYLDFLNKDNAFLVRQRPMYASRGMQYWHYHPKSLCANPDKQHLKQLMRYVFNNYQIAQQKAKRAYEQTAPRYTWDKVATQFVDLADKHKLLDKTSLDIKKEIPVGIVIPKTSSIPTRATEDEQVIALRENLKEKAKQALTQSTDEKGPRTTIATHTLVFNEEKNIVDLLENIIHVFDEIVIVDGGSTDETVKLIRSYIAESNANHIKLLIKPQVEKIRYSKRWNQSEQRNYALQQCRSDWVFMIDADERLDVGFVNKLYQLVDSGRSLAYAFPKHHYWEAEDKIRIDSYWYPNYSYRLWKNEMGIQYESRNRHCQPVVSHLRLPDVLAEKTVRDQGPYCSAPIHHLHYLKHTINEIGLYRANERDVKTLSDLRKGLKTKSVPSLSSVLKQSLKLEVSDVRTLEDNSGLLQNTLNIVFVMENFPFYSGGRYHLYQEAFALAKAGTNVWLVTNIIPPYINDFPKIENFRILENWNTPKNSKIDVVVGTPSNCGKRALDLARQHQAKLVLVSLETPNFIREYRGGRDSTEEYWKAYKKVLPFADYVLVSARLPAEYLKKWVKIPEERIVLMPPAINEYAFKKIGNIKQTNTLMFISRVVEHKKLDKLLAALGRVQKTVSNPPIIDIIGNGSSEKINKVLKDTGVQGRFFTNISDIAKFQLIKRSKGLITCSSYEGFGMSPLEGMFSDVPVICSDLPIFHETLGDRVTYYPLDDLAVLSNYLRALILTPNVFQTKIREAKEWVEQEYTIGAMTRRWKQLLPKLKEKNIKDETKLETTIKLLPDEKPKFSICIIALNEAEYIQYTLQQIYDWDCCHEIIIIEGSVDLYPKTNLSKDGLSGDGTTELIKNFPDPENKIRYVSGVFKDKVEQRNEYAKRVTGTHVLVLDADEFYSQTSLEKLKQDVLNNPNAELFMFDFSQDLAKRTYYHLWYNFQQHVVGGYWDIPHNRIYKWTEGTRYIGNDHNHPTKPDGTKLIKEEVVAIKTSAECIHTGFVKLVKNQKDKNDFYVNRGEGKEKDRRLRDLRQMYVNCRRAYENWTPKTILPHKARVLAFSGVLPESLLDHPYMQEPKYILKQRDGKC